MQSNDIDVVTKGNKMLTETVCLLLAADSDLQGSRGSDMHPSLYWLLDGIQFEEEKELLNCSYASASASRIRVTAEIARMLVFHGMKNVSEIVNEAILNCLISLFVIASISITTLTGIEECTEHQESMIDSFGNMYRCVLLSGMDENIYDNFSERYYTPSC